MFEVYSPLGSPGRPDIVDDDPVVLEDLVIKEIAEKKGFSPAQVSCSHNLLVLTLLKAHNFQEH